MSVKKASYASIFIAGMFLLSACGGETTPDPGASEITATSTPTPTSSLSSTAKALSSKQIAEAQKKLRTVLKYLPLLTNCW